MRPKTSVRQPIIAGARREHLSALMRKWRRQPRKRSLLLFWAFLSLALMSDTFLLVLGARLLSGSKSISPPTDRHIVVPYAADASLWEPLRHWVIRVDGRTQLFESFCREAVSEITGDEHFEGRDPLPVGMSWMLDKDANALKWDEYPCLQCEDAELRAVLYHEGRSPSRMSQKEQLHGRYVEPNVVSSSQSFDMVLQNVRAGEEAGGDIPLSSLERHAVELRNRLRLFEHLRTIGVDGWNKGEMQTASAALCESYHSGEKDLFAAGLNDFLDASRKAMGVAENPEESRRLACEAWLNKHTPSRKAMYLSLLAAGLFTTAAMVRNRSPRWRRRFMLWGLLTCLGCLGWALAALVCRAISEGTAPVSGGTQSILWCASLVMVVSLGLALAGKDAFLGWTGALVSSGGFLLANRWPMAFPEHWPVLPQGVAGDNWLCVQVLLLLSGYAALVLAWGVAALSLGRILLVSPTGERVRRLAARCVGPISIGVALLTASAIVDCCRAMVLGSSWHRWNAQAVGTLLVLPSCAALVYARRRGWIQPFAFMAIVVFGSTLSAMMGYIGIWQAIGKQTLITTLAAGGWFSAVGLLNLSLAAHAALRYYFGKQPILEA